MKKLLFVFILIFFACDTLTTEELAEEVKQNMIEHFSENDDVMDVKVVDFSLVHRGGNEYKGIVELIVENPVADLLNNWTEQEILNNTIEYTHTVEVIYDGDSYSWEVLDD